VTFFDDAHDIVTHPLSIKPPVKQVSSTTNSTKRKRHEYSAEQKRLAVFVAGMPLFTVSLTAKLFSIVPAQPLYNWLKDDFHGVNRFSVSPGTTYCPSADRPGLEHVTRSILVIEGIRDRSSLSNEELMILFESHAREVDYDLVVCFYDSNSLGKE
jgi:hypothetical protein